VSDLLLHDRDLPLEYLRQLINLSCSQLNQPVELGVLMPNHLKTAFVRFCPFGGSARRPFQLGNQIIDHFTVADADRRRTLEVLLDKRLECFQSSLSEKDVSLNLQ
jgi:hypothetical protein